MEQEQQRTSAPRTFDRWVDFESEAIPDLAFAGDEDSSNSDRSSVSGGVKVPPSTPSPVIHPDPSPEGPLSPLSAPSEAPRTSPSSAPLSAVHQEQPYPAAQQVSLSSAADISTGNAIVEDIQFLSMGPVGLFTSSMLVAMTSLVAGVSPSCAGTAELRIGRPLLSVLIASFFWGPKLQSAIRGNGSVWGDLGRFILTGTRTTAACFLGFAAADGLFDIGVDLLQLVKSIAGW